MIFSFIIAMVFASQWEQKFFQTFKEYAAYWKQITKFPKRILGNSHNFEKLPSSGFPHLHFAVFDANRLVTQFVCDTLIQEKREDLLETENDRWYGNTALIEAAIFYNLDKDEGSRPDFAGRCLDIVKILIRAGCSFVKINEVGDHALNHLQHVQAKILFDEFQHVYQKQGITTTALNLESFFLRNIATSYESRNQFKTRDKMQEGSDKDTYNEKCIAYWRTNAFKWQNIIYYPQVELSREYLKHLSLYFKGGFKYQHMMIEDDVHGKSVLELENEEMKSYIAKEYNVNCGQTEKMK